MARAVGNTLRDKAVAGLALGDAARRGEDFAWSALKGGGTGTGVQAPATHDTPGDTAPAWARQLRHQQDARHHRQVAMHVVRSGDHGGASATPDIKERDE